MSGDGWFTKINKIGVYPASQHGGKICFILKDMFLQWEDIKKHI
jgi:hypothetical protein